MSQQQKPGEGSKKPQRTGVSFGAYIDPALVEALNAYIERTEPRPSKTAILEMLLRQFLTGTGDWPRDSKKPRRKRGRPSTPDQP